MAYTLDDKKEAIKNELSDLKSKYSTAAANLLSTAAAPQMDEFNNNYLWGDGGANTNFGIMDLYKDFYAEIQSVFGGTLDSPVATIGGAGQAFTKANWDNHMSLATAISGDGAYGQTVIGMWPQGSSTINTASSYLINNGLAATYTSKTASDVVAGFGLATLNTSIGTYNTGTTFSYVNWNPTFSTTAVTGSNFTPNANLLYSAAPAVTIFSSTQTTITTPATFTAVLGASVIANIVLTSGGTGYTSATGLAISGGTGGTVDITAVGGVITAVKLSAVGSGYTNGVKTITQSANTTATVTVTIGSPVTSVTFTGGTYVGLTAMTVALAPANLVLNQKGTNLTNWNTVLTNMTTVKNYANNTYGALLTTSKNHMTKAVGATPLNTFFTAIALTDTTPATATATNYDLTASNNIDFWIDMLTNSSPKPTASIATMTSYFSGNTAPSFTYYYINRFNGLMSAIGSTASLGLNKWRTFWINERIVTGTGSLSQVQSMVTLQAKASSDIAAKVTTVNDLMGGILTIMPKQKVIASYYDPIVDETTGVLTAVRTTAMWDGKNHAEKYYVYRKTITSATNLFAELNTPTDFATQVVLLNIANATDKTAKGLLKNSFTDTTVLLNSIYAYRVKMSDSTTPFLATYTSLQSDLFSDNTIAASISFNTSQTTLTMTFATAHSYSGGLIFLNYNGNQYLVPMVKSLDDKNITILKNDVFGTAVQPFTGTINSYLTYGIVKASF